MIIRSGRNRSTPFRQRQVALKFCLERLKGAYRTLEKEIFLQRVQSVRQDIVRHLPLRHLLGSLPGDSADSTMPENVPDGLQSAYRLYIQLRASRGRERRGHLLSGGFKMEFVRWGVATIIDLRRAVGAEMAWF